MQSKVLYCKDKYITIGGNDSPYPSDESYSSDRFPTERKALRLLASRRSKEGSNGRGFLWMLKSFSLDLTWRTICEGKGSTTLQFAISVAEMDFV